MPPRHHSGGPQGLPSYTAQTKPEVPAYLPVLQPISPACRSRVSRGSPKQVSGELGTTPQGFLTTWVSSSVLGPKDTVVPATPVMLRGIQELLGAGD